ncbi:hypothetical protein MKEN_00640900 [Mycena kentingensis (nom. inval.)]|nr:hypothetical protein MKEN_00640900 [Mycena kentingensis (nom. inval.)]
MTAPPRSERHLAPMIRPAQPQPLLTLYHEHHNERTRSSKRDLTRLAAPPHPARRCQTHLCSDVRGDKGDAPGVSGGRGAQRDSVYGPDGWRKTMRAEDVARAVRVRTGCVLYGP